MNTNYLFGGIFLILIVIVSFQVYSMLGLSTSVSAPAASAPVQQAPQLKLPANIQSSAPMSFASFEEEVAYYKKNAKNPKNINIENAVRNMDADHNGQCDKCGMAILHCVESGMENM